MSRREFVRTISTAAAGGVEREPQGGVQFLRRTHFNRRSRLFEGAVETGERAAGEIISALR